MPPSNSADVRAECEDYLARVRTLEPRIAAAADTIEHMRRIPDDLLDALHAAKPLVVRQRHAPGDLARATVPGVRG
ncbi:MAG: hypothetical protein P8Y76_13885 [bacterium]